jgi:hypothetical protein
LRTEQSDVYLILAVRLALAILLDAAAFIVWDVGTRPPLTLLADVRRAFVARQGVASGIARFLCGLALIVLACLVIGPTMPDRRTFTIAETGMLIVALLVEQLVGPDLRRRKRAP